MNGEAHQKVQAEHLVRNAFLYVRQSTLRQVRENVESSQRQYGLRDRALALGWPLQQIVVIDCDQGQSGSGTVEREEFKRLVAEVSMSRAGIVMGLEVGVYNYTVHLRKTFQARNCFGSIVGGDHVELGRFNHQLS